MRKLLASLENIGATLGADLECGAEARSEEEELIMMVGASSQDTIASRLVAARKDGSVGRYLVICGDRPYIHEKAVENGVRALLVTAGYRPDEDIVKRAKEKGIVILCSPHDTATTVKLALCARMVKNVISDDFMVIAANQVFGKFSGKVAGSRQDLFPVVEAGTKRLAGVFSKSDLVNLSRTKLSLVDHNEFSQAVKGVEEAAVVEIIDHHRLSGDLITREPVRFINEPVGSSSTIVARRFREKGIEPDAAVALCLCAGLVSDTLNLSSPTTTEVDREILTWLSDLASVNPDEFAEDFFASGSLLQHADVRAIVGTDRKEFTEQGVLLSLSQVEETSFKGLEKRKEDLLEELERLRNEGGYSLCAVLVTDIQRHDSVLLATGVEDILCQLPFDRVGTQEFVAPGVVSRKKQLFPAVCEAIRKFDEGEGED